MKFLVLIGLFVFACTAQASVTAFTQAGAEIGTYAKLKCSSGVSCSESTGLLLVAGNTKHAISTSTVATNAMCGHTFINSASATVTLPEASTVPGCRLTFFTGASANMMVDPADGTDKILILTSAAGDRIRNSTLGSSLILESIGDDQWGVVGKEQGTWTDIDP